MIPPPAGRETLGFFAAALSGPVLLAPVVGLAFGFDTNRLKIVLGALLLAAGPAVIVFGLPVFYAIRKVRIPGVWWTVAFGAMTSAPPTVAFSLINLNAKMPGMPEPARSLVFLIMALGAAFCGAIGGLVFWLLVYKDAARANTAASRVSPPLPP